MGKNKFREKVVGFVGQMGRVIWREGTYDPLNIAVGFVAAVIRDSLLLSFPYAGRTIEIPLGRITSIKARGPDWGWHDEITWNEADAFSGHLALEKFRLSPLDKP